MWLVGEVLTPFKCSNVFLSFHFCRKRHEIHKDSKIENFQSQI